MGAPNWTVMVLGHRASLSPTWNTRFFVTLPTERVRKRVKEWHEDVMAVWSWNSCASYFHHYNYSFCWIDLAKSRYTWTLTAVRPQKVLSSWNGGRHGGGHSGRRDVKSIAWFCSVHWTLNHWLWIQIWKKIEKEAAGIYEMAKINTKDPAQSYILAC